MDKLEIFKNVIEKIIIPRYPWIKSVEVGSVYNDPMFGEMFLVKYYVLNLKVIHPEIDVPQAYQLAKKVEDETMDLLKMLGFFDEIAIKNFVWELVNPNK